MNKVKIGITGVAGFIGSNLAEELLEMGHEVIGADDFSYGRRSNIEKMIGRDNFQFFEMDIINDPRFISLNADVWVHLASQKIPRYSNSLKTLIDNQVMTEILIEKCISDKSKLVFASTSDVYGKNASIPFHEESDLVMGPTTVKRWSYAVSKMYSEHKIIANSEEFGLEYCIMRFFGSYGPNQNTTWWGGPQAVFIQNILESKNIELHGDGLQTRTFTYIKDTVQGIIKCILHPNSKNEIFNVANEPTEEVSIKELAELILNKMHEHATNSGIIYRPYSDFGKYEDVMRRVPDIHKIKSMLDFKPSWSLEKGIEETIKWQMKFNSQVK